MSRTENTSNKSGLIIFDHAKIDPSHCLANGLFKPLQRGSNEQFSLDIRYDYKAFLLRWQSKNQLSISDQSILISIHRIASDNERYEVVGDDCMESVKVAGRQALQLAHTAITNSCYVIETSLYEIGKIIGLAKSGTNNQSIRDGLQRLSNTRTTFYRNGDESNPYWASQMISVISESDKLLVFINPMLTKAINSGPYTFIDLNEQRQLKGEVSKRLHVWLCSWITHGSQRKIQLDKLIPHIWGDTSEANANRTRRNSLRKAIDNISQLSGWVCEECDTTNDVIIVRPRLSKLSIK